MLASLTQEPAYVFGSSLGGLIGLDLTMRYPDRVRKVVTHEPPLVRLLSPAEGAASAPVVRHDETVDAAIRRFTSEMGIDRESMAERTTDPAEREKRTRKRSNMEFFMAHEAAGVGQQSPTSNACGHCFRRSFLPPATRGTRTRPTSWPTSRRTLEVPLSNSPATTSATCSIREHSPGNSPSFTG